MIDDLFPFLDTEPMENDLFEFISQVDALLETPEKFLAEYQRLYIASPSEESRKQLDFAIGLALIGQKGREQIAERVRLLQEKRMSQ